MNDIKDLINWVELSRRIAGNETSISRNRIPKKYKKEVDAIISAMGNCLHNLSKVKIDFSKVDNYEISGIDTKDYPDFSDAYIESCDYNGKPANEYELDLINLQCDFMDELVMNQIT